MPDLISMQPTTTAPGQTGALSSPPGSGGHAGAFAALLFGSMQPGRRLDGQSAVGARVAGPTANTAEDANQLAQSGRRTKTTSGAPPRHQGLRRLNY